MLEVDMARGGPYESLIEPMRNAGLEQSSGLRRYIVRKIGEGRLDIVADILKVSPDEAERIRNVFIEAWGEP